MNLMCKATNRERRLLLTVIVVVIVVVLGSCRVKYSFTGASISSDIETISIEYFQNRASLVQPNLSQRLTEALIDKCRSQTNLQLVSEFGDVSFEGEITDYKTSTLTISGDARASANRFTISVRVRFNNTVEPDNSYEQVFSRHEDYDSNLNLSQVEASLSENIIDLLIEDIFNRAFINW